ncbi:hypothetical protein EPO05_01820 [Patescibacteria group bacterium]|nr:MAG: hypothetical protein EPO05_01820 [Patescibacteria group bacterium]
MRLESWRKFKSFNDNHPEKLEDETFFGNQTEEEFGSLLWKTKRMGNTAYDDNGIIPEGPLRKFPVFVKKSEYEVFKQRVLI